jgi:ribonuclease PH
VPRPDNRRPDQLRPLTIEANIAPHATGSVLLGFGATRVICAATIEAKVPSWMKQQGVKGGWLTAEYSMLPYSTLDRKPRDITKGRIDGRTVEIQRLIGRSLRAVLDLQKLGEQHPLDRLRRAPGRRRHTHRRHHRRLPCGPSRHPELLDAKKISENPLTDSVAAVSVGLFKGEALLDLNYIEDKDAEVDANVVMTGRGQFVEVQSSGEESTFSHEQLQQLLGLAQKGMTELAAAQTAFLAKHLL